jgi:hypothetical protein
MDHFDIVLTLARIALDGQESRAMQQILRLRDQLANTDPEQAAKLGRLLSRNGRRQTMAPLAMEEMKNMADAARRQLPGENLSHSTPLPTDPETGTPLARLLPAPSTPDDAPILNASLSSALSDLLTEWRRGEDLARIGARPHMNCLIYGPPGVGKTKLARYLAQQLGLPCLEARLDGLVSSFLGTTARNIGGLFEFANRYRCVLFLDEFDAVAKARDDSQEIGEIKRVVNTLLQSLDARNGIGITLAATNHEHLLDTAVWRRFDARIELPKPDAEARQHLLRKFLSPLKLKSGEIQFLIWATDGMSGADIQMLVDAGKRFFVLHGQSTREDDEEQGKIARSSLVLEGLRRQASINSRLFSTDRARLLSGSLEELDRALEHAGLTQVDRGTVLGRSQSAISRLRKRGETHDAQKDGDSNA